MKKLVIFLIIFSVTQLAFCEEPIPNSIEDIKITLNSDAEINNALIKIKKWDKKVFQELINLKKTDSEKFKEALYRHYYTYVHTSVLVSKDKEKEKGYRLLIKESEIEFNKLSEEYKNAKTDEEKSIIKSKIKEASIKRYEAELKMRNHKIDQVERYLKDLKDKNKLFEDNKELYLSRLTNKCTGNS